MKQFLLSLVAGLLVGAGIMFFYMNTKLKKYDNLREMAFEKHDTKKISPDQNIGRALAHTYVTNYQSATGLPIKGVRFATSELTDLLNSSQTDPDEIIVYFGKKNADPNRKGDYTTILATIKNNTQQDAYYADQASPCPEDCPNNAIGN